MASQGKGSRANLKTASMITALGVVFGDIGTSPLYGLRECFNGAHAVELLPANVFGVVSLIFWSLTLIVTCKYLFYVMRADNRGEGGVLALMALAKPLKGVGEKLGPLVYLGLFGAALLYGDGIITPAISVLSAVEGLKVATPFFEPYILPITTAILIGLFLIQHRGTGKIGSLFGPIIFVWFLVQALLGIGGIFLNPEIFWALNPIYGIEFLLQHGPHGFLALGAVFLVVTGAEALYADMGHFGRVPIQYAWLLIAYPGLVLNYLGQGALLISRPGTVSNPFFYLCPPEFLYGLVVLATCASVIASQALISGAFSLTSQAITLGFLPRMTISYTSKDEIGQIYISRINSFLLVATIWLVITFKTSSNLASAYGIAVSLTMVCTTILISRVALVIWHWPRLLVFAITIFLLAIESAFLGANLYKILEGGWFSLLISLFVFVIMTTWRRGRELLRQRLIEKLPSFDIFAREIPEHTPLRVPGTAIYMNTHQDLTPPALLYNLKHNKVVHEHVLVVVVVTEEVPFVSPVRRATLERINKYLHRVIVRYGFMEVQNVPRALRHLDKEGLNIDLDNATYFLGRETLLASPRPGMAIWREELFAFMSRNAQKAAWFFGIKADQVIEIGFEVEL